MLKLDSSLTFDSHVKQPRKAPFHLLTAELPRHTLHREPRQESPEAPVHPEQSCQDPNESAETPSHQPHRGISLHWLPISLQIEFKTLLRTFPCVLGNAPPLSKNNYSPSITPPAPLGQATPRPQDQAQLLGRSAFQLDRPQPLECPPGPPERHHRLWAPLKWA